MKILHTSDWHIGHNFFKIDRTKEFLQFFDWLEEVIKKENIDILLVSGDIFDVYFPSNEAIKLYYDVLLKFRHLKKVVIVGGNHDSYKTLKSAKEILKLLNIIVVSGAEDDFCEVIEFDNFNIVAVSYLREGILRKIDLKTLYQSNINPNKKNIATAHLSVYGAQFGDSEREIGSLESVPSSVFEGYDYVALGHIHKPQEVDKNIVYSGSVLSLNFSETYTKKVVILDTDTMEYKFINIPKFREFIKLKGSFDEIKQKIQSLPKDSFVDIELTEVVSSFDLEKLYRDDIFIVKKTMPYTEITQEIKNIDIDNIIDDLFKDDSDYQEIKSIIKEIRLKAFDEA
jgi:exonuclease SbcD